MIEKNSLEEEQRDCANMLGISLEEYQLDLKKVKAPAKENISKNYEYDNTILEKMGIEESMLKKKKYNI